MIPLASANTITAMKFIARLNTEVSETDSGITMRGKRTLRSNASRPTRHWTHAPVASEKYVHSTIPVSRYTP